MILTLRGKIEIALRRILRGRKKKALKIQHFNTLQYIAVFIYLCLVLKGQFNVYSTGNAFSGVIRILYILYGILSDICYKKVLRLTWDVKSVPFTWNMG